MNVMSWTVSRSEEGGRRMDVRMAAQLTWEGEAFFGLTTLILQQSVGTGRERKKSRRSCSRSRMKDREASSRLRLSQLSPSPQSSSLLSLCRSLKSGTSSKRRKRRMSAKVRREESNNFFSFFIHPRCRHSVVCQGVNRPKSPSPLEGPFHP